MRRNLWEALPGTQFRWAGSELDNCMRKYNIIEKLGVYNRTQAVVQARELELF